MSEFSDDFYTLSQEQGLCQVGDVILNLGKIALIAKSEGRTLVYRPGAADPIALPGAVFGAVKDAVFAIGEGDDEDEDGEFEEE